MEWIKIDPENLPKGEVLAANFAPRTFGYKEKLIGCLSIEGGEVRCEDENTALYTCTHYIDIHKFDPKQ